jgi:signal transduction histidine kinase
MKPTTKPKPLYLDIIKAILIAAGGTAIGIYFDIYDNIHTYTRAHEEYELDEFLGVGLPVIGMVFIYYYIKRHQELALIREEARRAAIQTTANTMMHHIRQPLTVSMGSISYMQKHQEMKPGELPDNYTELLNDIRKSQEKIERILVKISENYDGRVTVYMPGVEMLKLKSTVNIPPQQPGDVAEVTVDDSIELGGFNICNANALDSDILEHTEEV